jgi:hypothetical protein
MDRHVLMSLLESVVLPDVVQVITSDHDCPLHLQLDDDTSQDSPSDEHIACEGTFLVDITSFCRLNGKDKRQTSLSPQSHSPLLAS